MPSALKSALVVEPLSGGLSGGCSAEKTQETAPVAPVAWAVTCTGTLTNGVPLSAATVTVNALVAVDVTWRVPVPGLPLSS